MSCLAVKTILSQTKKIITPKCLPRTLWSLITVPRIEETTHEWNSYVLFCIFTIFNNTSPSLLEILSIIIPWLFFFHFLILCYVFFAYFFSIFWPKLNLTWINKLFLTYLNFLWFVEVNIWCFLSTISFTRQLKNSRFGPKHIPIENNADDQKFNPIVWFLE